MLTPKMKADRVDWYEEHLDDDWDSTIFSDETIFRFYRIKAKQTMDEMRKTKKIGSDPWPSLDHMGWDQLQRKNFAGVRAWDDRYPKILRNFRGALAAIRHQISRWLAFPAR